MPGIINWVWFILLPPLWRWGSSGRKRSSTLLRSAELLSGRAGIWTEAGPATLQCQCATYMCEPCLSRDSKTDSRTLNINFIRENTSLLFFEEQVHWFVQQVLTDSSQRTTTGPYWPPAVCNHRSLLTTYSVQKQVLTDAHSVQPQVLTDAHSVQ